MPLSDDVEHEVDLAAPFLPATAAWADPLWSGLRNGVLIIQKCECCGNFVYPPVEEMCAHCDNAYTWHQASGTAKLWSWVTFHRTYYPGYPLEPPYTVLMVELEEGVRMLAALGADTAVEDLRCDMAMQFRPLRLSRDVLIPSFISSSAP
jgi:uncharacterized protein